MLTTSPSLPARPASLPLIVTSTAPALPIVTFVNPESVNFWVEPLNKIPCQSTVPLLSVTESQLFALTAVKLTVLAMTGVAEAEVEADGAGVALAEADEAGETEGEADGAGVADTEGAACGAALFFFV